MTAAAMTAGDLAAVLALVTGDESLGASLSAATRLEGDLCLDSLDLVALAARLRDRYGSAVDLVGYVAGLGIDEIIGLTVGDVCGYVDRCRQDRPAMARPAVARPAGPPG
jgi:acyl carrier protein